MAKRKRPAHLVILEKAEAHFENLKKNGFDTRRGTNLNVVRSVHMIKFSSGILSEMIIPKGALGRVITRLVRMRDYKPTTKTVLINTLYNSLSETIEELERRR